MMKLEHGRVAPMRSKKGNMHDGGEAKALRRYNATGQNSVQVKSWPRVPVITGKPSQKVDHGRSVKLLGNCHKALLRCTTKAKTRAE